MAAAASPAPKRGDPDVHDRAPRSLRARTRGDVGFGPRQGEGFDGTLRLAFALDGLREQAGVMLRQQADGTVHSEVEGVAPGSLQTVERQVGRVLSLEPWRPFQDMDIRAAALCGPS